MFDVLEMNIILIRQAGPYDKTGEATKGVGGAKFDFPNTFSNPLISCASVYFYKKKIEKKFLKEILSIIMINCFCLLNLIFLRKIFIWKCN